MYGVWNELRPDRRVSKKNEGFPYHYQYDGFLLSCEGHTDQNGRAFAF